MVGYQACYVMAWYSFPDRMVISGVPCKGSPEPFSWAEHLDDSEGFESAEHGATGYFY
jgi:hypothetical protein